MASYYCGSDLVRGSVNMAEQEVLYTAFSGHEIFSHVNKLGGQKVGRTERKIAMVLFHMIWGNIKEIYYLLLNLCVF